ncbi:unnamed protein product, partial [Heterosigma akashiwo]
AAGGLEQAQRRAAPGQGAPALPGRQARLRGRVGSRVVRAAAAAAGGPARHGQPQRDGQGARPVPGAQTHHPGSWAGAVPRRSPNIAHQEDFQYCGGRKLCSTLIVGALLLLLNHASRLSF